MKRINFWPWLLVFVLVGWCLTALLVYVQTSPIYIQMTMWVAIGASSVTFILFSIFSKEGEVFLKEYNAVLIVAGVSLPLFLISLQLGSESFGKAVVTELEIKQSNDTNFKLLQLFLRSNEQDKFLWVEPGTQIYKQNFSYIKTSYPNTCADYYLMIIYEIDQFNQASKQRQNLELNKPFLTASQVDRFVELDQSYLQKQMTFASSSLHNFETVFRDCQDFKQK